ncbi:hypothetical protein H4R18_001535 [Coemansia javaensis]|uniref:PAS domain-containing protein n=1 Tax=Coemansia javaensis TaxID=2761396 RepID=A0A9W8LL96_9FUNG|nr:hypothetical protein H4R18_001535 [Coemansia javaensis]
MAAGSLGEPGRDAAVVVPAERDRPARPSYIGVHTRDDTTQILYTSSGSLEAFGHPPEFLNGKQATDLIADHFDHDDYLRLLQHQEKIGFGDQDDDEDDGEVFSFFVHVKHADGEPVLHRATIFPCDSAVVFIGMSFPGVPMHDRRELTVQMLEGAMRRRNVTQERIAQEASQKKQTRVYSARTRHVKAVFVLEYPDVPGEPAFVSGRQRSGPVVAFATGSVSRLIDADTSDVMREPFLKLVAPEDLLHVADFFDRLGCSTDVMFETFSLLERPHLIDGDIVVPDRDNRRIVVECLAASSKDGIVLLARKTRSVSAPSRDRHGNYIRTRIHELDEDGGYISLAELISSDPDTSDAPEWSVLH